MNRVLLGVTTIASIVACSPKNPPEGAAGAEPAPLIGTEWTLDELERSPAPLGADNRPATLLLSAGEPRASGFGGCNRFAGSFAVKGDSLRLGPLAMTRMACAQGNELEIRFAQLLERVRTHRINGRALELMAGDSVVVRMVADDRRR